MAAKLPIQVVNEIKAAISSNERRRHEDGKPSLVSRVVVYQESGWTPYRYRIDLRRTVLPNRWTADLSDRFPDLTDANIDTAMRSAIADMFPLGEARDWAISQPLKR